MQHLDQFAHGPSAVLQVCALALGEVEVHDFFDAARAELDGDADEEVVYAVLALEVGCAGENSF